MCLKHKCILYCIKSVVRIQNKPIKSPKFDALRKNQTFTHRNGYEGSLSTVL